MTISLSLLLLILALWTQEKVIWALFVISLFVHFSLT
jgi:hypothetical protein